MGLAVVPTVNVSVDHVTQYRGSVRAMQDLQTAVAVCRAKYV